MINTIVIQPIKKIEYLMFYLGNSPFFEHLVQLLDVDVDEVCVGDDPVCLSVRLKLIIIALRSHTFEYVISAIV